MKKFFVIALLACIAIGIKAEKTKILVVSLKTNTTVEFILSESPTVKFLKDSIKIASTTLSGQYAYDNVRNLHFEEKDLTGIQGTQVSENTLRIIYAGTNKYVIAGLKTNDNVRLFNLSGQVLKTPEAQDGAVTISLQDLATGAYIINVAGKHAVKVTQK